MSSGSSEQLNQYFDASRGELTDVLIRAGAGAGKTTELVRRVISLAKVQHDRNGQWPKLVVTTFTRKATQELRERLLHAGLSIGDKELLQYLQNSQSLHISTIHGILTVYLKRFGRQLDLPPDFQIIDAAQASRLARKTLRALLKDPDFAQDFQLLSEELDLRSLEEAASEWCGVQMENPAAKRISKFDLQEDYSRRAQVVEDGVHEVVSGLQSVKLTESWQKILAVFQAFQESGEGIRAQIQNFQENVAGLRFVKTKDVPDELKDLAAETRENALALAEYPSQDDFWSRHEDLSLRFERLARAWGERIRFEKIRTAKLTMEDLELFALWLVDRFPDTAANFSADWDYWLIDEYQDTSPRQVKLIKALTQGRKTFVVGDPQQSIYLFRGARSEVFIEAETQVRDQGGEILQLMKNYRTSAPVLEYMNKLFGRASTQLSPMEAGRQEQVLSFPHVMLWQLPKEKKSEGLQVEAVLQRVQELIHAGASPESICVLSRKRADLGAIARRAAELGVPCQLHAAGQFFERREVQDALAFLKFLVTPEDNENLVALLRSPWLELTDQQILEICDREERSFWSRLKQKTTEKGFESTVQLFNDSLARVQREGIPRVWRDLLVSQGLFDYAQTLDPSGRREANLWKLVQNLFASEAKPGFRILDFLAQPESADTESGGMSGDASPVVEPKRVQLMTVHASKGLQFPHVIVPFLEDDLIKVDRGFFCWNEQEKTWGLALKDPETQKLSAPTLCENAFELQKKRGREELDRLFYVALTRAQSSLHLIWTALGEKTKVEKPWISGLLSTVESGSESSWKIDYREHLPESLTLQVASNETGSVRQPWQAAAPQNEKLRQVLSVTSLLAVESPPAAAAGAASTGLTRPANLRNFAKVRSSVRGTEVHRLMESLKYDPDRKLANEENQAVLDFLDQTEGQFLKPLIAEGEVEWGFATRFRDRLLQGQIDLWGRDLSGQAWVVDYKTGNPEGAEKALFQLEIYTWALKKLGRLSEYENVLLAAVFPFQQSLVKRQAPSQAEIEKKMDQQLKLLPSVR